jgi:hydroxymethylbilane synthase
MARATAGPGRAARATLRLATRKSPLAQFQAEQVAELLRALDTVEAVELVFVESAGDRNTEIPLSSFAEHGVFTTEVEQAVLVGRADIAVHSAKDLPSSDPPPGMVLAAVPVRVDVRDALVGGRLDELPAGSVIATGSVRRRVQLAAYRTDLGFTELRGNIATRLTKAPHPGAVVIANAALIRLGLEDRAAEVLATSMVLPQVGQGAIALRCREDDDVVRGLLQQIDDPVAHRCVLAERAYLARLGGGCDAPVGAHARPLADGGVEIDAMLASGDGHVVLRRSLRGADPIATGRAVAEALLNTDGGSDLFAASEVA